MPGSETAERRRIQGLRKARTQQSVRVFVALVVLAATLGLHAGPVGAQGGQTTGVSEITIEVVGRGVAVEEVLRPSRSGTVSVLVPPEAVNLAASGPIVDERIQDGFRQIDVEAESAGTTISYTLSSTTGRAQDGTRVNDAMIGFHLWPSLSTVELDITLPRGFTANVGPAFAASLVAEETLNYQLGATNRDQLWGLWFVALRDSGLVTQEVEIGDGDTIVVAAWADDPQWMAFASSYVADGVPVLEDLTGIPWPVEDLRLVESVLPSQAGYGGWFDLRESEILVPDSLDADVFVHELAHGWFNDLLLDDRWTVEGFAEAYAARALVQIEGRPAVAVEPGPAPPDIDGLNEWGTPLFVTDINAYETYGYTASYWVVDQLLDELGVAGMRRTLLELEADRHPYQIEDDRRFIGTNDWRRLLDQLELTSGSTRAEELYRQYVITRDQVSVMDERRETLDRYLLFENESGGRETVPRGIRYAMADWDFEQAVAGMNDATRLQGELDDIETKAVGLGMGLPSYLVDIYRTSDLGFPRLEEAIEETNTLLTAFEQDPDVLDDATRRNFSLGRYEQIDIDLETGIPGQLNPDRSDGFELGWTQGLVGGSIVLALGAVLVARQLAREQEQARTAVHTRKSGATGSTRSRMLGGSRFNEPKMPSIPTYLPDTSLAAHVRSRGESDTNGDHPDPSDDNGAVPSRVSEVGKNPPMPDESLRAAPPKRGRHSKW